MDLVAIIERIGEAPTAALLGLVTGAVFGVAAQRSRFCLRAATVEFARRQLGPRVAVWLLCFSTALVWVQAAELLGFFRVEEARMMAVPGTWSGAVIGGLVFGVGMVMSRGCPGRLLVLAASGNLRSVVSGLIFAVVAQIESEGHPCAGARPAGRAVCHRRRAEPEPDRLAGPAARKRADPRGCHRPSGAGHRAAQPDRRLDPDLRLRRRLFRGTWLDIDLCAVAGQLRPRDGQFRYLFRAFRGDADVLPVARTHP